MLQDAPVQMVLPDGSVLLQLKNTHRPHGWPANNFFYQPCSRPRWPTDWRAIPNVTVLRGREVTRFEQDASGVDRLPRRQRRIGLLQAGAAAGARPQPVPGEARVRAR